MFELKFSVTDAIEAQFMVDVDVFAALAHHVVICKQRDRGGVNITD